MGWTQAPGAARWIGAFGDSVWVVGLNEMKPGGFGIFRWNGAGWDPMPGAALTIAVNSAGNPWVTNSQNNIFEWDGRSWLARPGSATDIGAGVAVWCIGTNMGIAGGGVWRWNGSAWEPNADGAGTRIAVDKGGLPWVVNKHGDLFHWNGTQWVPSALSPVQNVGSGNAGTWVLGQTALTNVETGEQILGSGVHIAVGNRIWVVNDKHEIWVWN